VINNENYNKYKYNHTPQLRLSLHFNVLTLKRSKHLKFCQIGGIQYEEMACSTSIDHRFQKNSNNSSNSKTL